MKLKELLKHHNIAWPEGATHAVQDKDGWIKFAGNSNIKLLPNGCWDHGFCPQSKGYVVPNLPLASDWDTAIVSRPVAHPHADLMLQYAQDAMSTTEPWKLWQSKGKASTWWDCKAHPVWGNDTEYRRKPKTHTIHGVEIPDLRVSPELGEKYYLADPTTPELAELHTFVMWMEGLWAERGLCYQNTEEGKQAAILHAKAMLGVQP